MTDLTRAVSSASTLLVAGGTVGTKFAHRAFATVAPVSGGSLLVTYRRGTREASLDGSVCLLTLTPNGSGGWIIGAEQTIVDGTMNDSIFTGTSPLTPLPDGSRPSIRDIHVRRFASGRVALTFCSQPTSYIESSPGVYNPSFLATATWQTWFMYSDGDGAPGTWSTPTKVQFTGIPGSYSQGAFGDDLLELADGSLMASAYAYNGFSGTWSAICARSTDAGATWPYHSTISGPIGGFNAVETSLSLLPSGAVYATFHTEDGVPTNIYATTLSAPYLAGSWTTPVAVFTSVSNNRNSALRHPDGDLLQFYANYNAGLTQGFHQSFTEGASFGSYTPVFSPPSGFANSDWIQGCSFGFAGVSPNLALVAAYERTDQSQANIYFATLTRGTDSPALPPLTLGPSSTWAQSGTALTVTAPATVRTSVQASVYSAGGGVLRFDGADSSRFSASLDNSSWATTIAVPAGSSTVYLSCVPLVTDTVLSASVGVPV